MEFLYVSSLTFWCSHIQTALSFRNKAVWTVYSKNTFLGNPFIHSRWNPYKESNPADFVRSDVSSFRGRGVTGTIHVLREPLTNSKHLPQVQSVAWDWTSNQRIGSVRSWENLVFDIKWRRRRGSNSQGIFQLVGFRDRCSRRPSASSTI